MSSSEVVLAVAVFVASTVEMIEALTVVLAVGTTRGWRSSLEGVLAALVVLAAIVVAFGPALVKYVPINLLRSVVGGVLLIYGLQWLRKAVLRAGGLKEKRNEDLVFETTVAKLRAGSRSPDRDIQGFVISFKGVFIEGLEVIIIVLTLGSSAHDLGLAVLSALSAAVVVTAVGLIVARQLSGVPENTMKLIVGLMLISFGTFWGGEGMGLKWPGSDLMIPLLVLAYGAVTYLLVKFLAASRLARAAGRLEAHSEADEEPAEQSLAGGEVITLQHRKALPLWLVEGFLRFWWELLVGDTPELFIGTVAIFGVAELLLDFKAPSLVLVLVGPILVVLLLNLTVAIAFRTISTRS
ncbi:MAG: hypothetical protein M0Z39_11415 [Actinomycetota bacterium]|nr:hypothetical protein [Actinomycetota bacterium]